MIRFCCCLVGKEEGFLEESYGTSGGTRTHTLVKEADFESAASTNSATLAIKKWYPEKDSNLQPID